MKKDYQRCLDKLASTAPETKSALIRSLLPGIEAALNSGKRLKAIWEALREEGQQMSYHSFHKTASRSRKVKKPTATSILGKQPNLLRHEVCGKQKLKESKSATRWQI